MRKAARAAVLAVLLAACANGAPTSSNPSASETLTPTPTAAFAASPTPTPNTSPGAGRLTDAEIGGLTGGRLLPLPVDAAAPKVDAAAAEAIVRMAYPGERTTIEVRRVAIQLPQGVRIGWLIALTPMNGAPCALHAGLLPRAIEGGIVDDQTGDQFWGFICG